MQLRTHFTGSNRHSSTFGCTATQLTTRFRSICRRRSWKPRCVCNICTACEYLNAGAGQHSKVIVLLLASIMRQLSGFCVDTLQKLINTDFIVATAVSKPVTMHQHGDPSRKGAEAVTGDERVTNCSSSSRPLALAVSHPHLTPNPGSSVRDRLGSMAVAEFQLEVAPGGCRLAVNCHSQCRHQWSGNSQLRNKALLLY